MSIFMCVLSRTLLIIGYVWPEPNSSAAGGHMLSLLRLFRDAGWSLHYASPAARGEHECDLSLEDIKTHEISLNCSSFDTFVAELNPDAVLFDRFLIEEQFGWRVSQACPDAMRILDMEDVHSLRDARHRAIKAGKPIEEAVTTSEVALREAAAIFRCDLSLVISDKEVEFLKSTYLIPETLMVHCPFLIQIHERAFIPFEGRAHFISRGNFRHAPNWDAVLQLKEKIWPFIRKSLPEAQLHIYGAYPPPKAVSLHNEREGFLVKGWVTDAQEVMSKARVCLSPLRFGAGLKGKLTEAMLCGTPSVTTKVGAEGIQGAFPWAGAVVEGDQAFAQAAIALYSDKRAWIVAQKRGESILKSRFNKDEITQRVMKKVESVYRDLPAHRAKNFIGEMLQHHSMKSTQYLSQWIEAKGKHK